MGAPGVHRPAAWAAWAISPDALALLGTLLALWWLASHGEWVNRAFLPTPEATLASLAAGLGLQGRPGALAGFLLATLQRVLLGGLLAAAAGVGLGALLGSSAAARVWLQPGLEFLRPLPASAVIPLAIAVFGLSSSMVLAVVVFGAMWPVLLATLHGMASVPRQLNEVAALLQLGRVAIVIRIALPHALPDIFSGIRLAMTVALIVSVVGEMVASQPGLGQALLLAARSFRAADLFAGLVLLGATGSAIHAMLAFAERRLLAWQRP